MVTADVQSSSASNQLRSDLNSIAERFLPHYTSKHSVVSTEMLLSQAADVIAVEQLRSAGLALAMVLFVIAVSFGSVKAGGLVVLPNVLPIVTNLGVMTLVGISLSDATSIISATAIGIAVDSTVHLLSSIGAGERCMSSRRAAVLHTLVSTGRPVVVSSFVVVLGFSFLLLSEFGSVADLGILTALTMIYCLIADLFVLPAQLLLSKKYRDEPDPFILICRGRPVVASGVQDENGKWVFTGCGGGARRTVDLQEVSDISRVGLNGEQYQLTDFTY
jgi:predicted RND superfamily exporter protein